MNEAQRALAQSRLDLVEQALRGGKLSGPETEDLRQAGREALCRAAVRYDPSLGGFEPFAARCIRNALLDLCREHARRTRLLTEFPDPDGGPPSPLPTPEREAETRELRLAVLRRFRERRDGASRAMARCLDELALRSEGYSTREIAEHGGSDVRTVNARISRARKLLRPDPVFRSLSGTPGP